MSSQNSNENTGDLNKDHNSAGNNVKPNSTTEHSTNEIGKENVAEKARPLISDVNIEQKNIRKPINWKKYLRLDITGIATVALVLLTFYLYRENEKLRIQFNYRTNADFYENLRSHCFDAAFMDAVKLFDMNQIIFISDPSNEDTMRNIIKEYPVDFPNGVPEGFSKKFPPGYPIFWIRTQFSELNISSSNRQYYSSYEIDALFMNIMDDLGQYYNTNIITEINYVQNGFGWYIQTIWESKPIKQYVIWLRENYYDETAHSHAFESLYWHIRNTYMDNSKIV